MLKNEKKKFKKGIISFLEKNLGNMQNESVGKMHVFKFQIFLFQNVTRNYSVHKNGLQNDIKYFFKFSRKVPLLLV